MYSPTTNLNTAILGSLFSKVLSSLFVLMMTLSCNLPCRKTRTERKDPWVEFYYNFQLSGSLRKELSNALFEFVKLPPSDVIALNMYTT